MLQRSFESSRNREVREGLCTNLQSLMSHSRFGWRSPLSTELSWNYDGSLHPTSRYSEAHVPLRETHVHEEFRSSSSAPFGKQFGRCVWPQPCSKVVEGQIRGVVCDAAVQADIQVQDLFFCRITQLTERYIGEESSQMLLWPAWHSTVRGR